MRAEQRTEKVERDQNNYVKLNYCSGPKNMATVNLMCIGPCIILITEV